MQQRRKGVMAGRWGWARTSAQALNGCLKGWDLSDAVRFSDSGKQDPMSILASERLTLAALWKEGSRWSRAELGSVRMPAQWTR